MVKKENLAPYPAPSNDLSCPMCDGDNVTTRQERDTFVYGAEDDSAEISAIVPVHRCQSCGFEFTDDSADIARHAAVCNHLGVLTPAEITAIREQYDLSRAEFARITKIGEASINRWETGQLIQNPALDRYLYLLSIPQNFERVRDGARHGDIRLDNGYDRGGVVIKPNVEAWRVLKVTESVRVQQRSFAL